MDSQSTFMQSSGGGTQASNPSSETRSGAIAPIERVTIDGEDAKRGSDWKSKVDETIQQVVEEVVQLLSSYQQVLIYIVATFLAVVFLRLTFVAVDTIHSIPIFAFIFELIGLGFSVWFSTRYLVRVATRAELQDELTNFRHRFIAAPRDGERS